VAERIAGLIDGLYLREVLGRATPDGAVAVAQVLAALEMELAGVAEEKGASDDL
jgi:TetR/AcrR family transcriptional repressor of bet genes